MIENNLFEKEANIPKERYFNDGYYKRKQFDSLVSQLVEIFGLGPKKILEIGVGNGFVSSFIKLSGIEITTFDINSSLNPDVIGNVVEIDNYFTHNSFELVTCSEVLEHIPFEYFEPILKKLSEISSRNVLLTLPRQHRIIIDFKCHLKLPFLKPLKLNLFRSIPNRQKWDGHFWEIDFSSEYSHRRISEIISKYFIIEKNYVNEFVRHHQYYILRCKNK